MFLWRCLWHTACRHPVLSPLCPHLALPIFPWELGRRKHCAYCSPAHTAAAGRGTPSGPARGLLSHTQKWIVWGDTCADKASDFLGKGRPGGEQQGEGTQESCSAPAAASGFLVGLVSGRLGPITLTQGPSWWRAQHSAKMDSSEKDSGK